GPDAKHSARSAKRRTRKSQYALDCALGSRQEGRRRKNHSCDRRRQARQPWRLPPPHERLVDRRNSEGPIRRDAELILENGFAEIVFQRPRVAVVFLAD